MAKLPFFLSWIVTQPFPCQGLRQRLGMEAGGQIVAEETSDGILLRAGATFPLEVYSEERRAEFARNNETALAGYRLKN